jgi:hypothetical protein
MDEKYIEYKFPTSLYGWKVRLFYIGNHKPTLPEITTEPPKITSEWREITYEADMDLVNELLNRMKVLKKEGVTRASVMYSWIGRRIKPLQK